MKSDQMVSGRFLTAGMIISDGKMIMEVIQVTFQSLFRVRFVYRQYPDGEEYLSVNYAGMPEFYFHGYATELLNVA